MWKGLIFKYIVGLARVCIAVYKIDRYRYKSSWDQACCPAI